MSDKYYLLSYYVKLCQTCLSGMSIIVIVCQTCLSWAVAQDVEILVGGSGEELIVDAIESGQLSNLVEIPNGLSDTLGQDQSLIVDIFDEKSAESQSGIDISHDVESGSMADAVSNGSGEIPGSGSSDTTGVLLLEESPSIDTGPGAVQQDVAQTAYSREPDASQTDMQSFELMTSFAPPNPSPQLSITEVRIDGTDEYIELTNRGDPFVGSISISGVKTSGLLTVGLDLGTNDSVVIGDTMTMVEPLGFDTLFNQSLSMTDTAARSLQLIYSGDVIDTLDLSATQILSSDNQSAAREYDFAQQIWQVTPVDHNANIVAGHRGNPGLVRGLTLFGLSTGSTMTGSTSTGSTNTGSIGTGIVISQVYPFSDCVGEHLVLSFSTDYSGSLTIAGLGTSDTSKTFDISAQSGSIRYIVESMSGVLSDNVVLVPNMTLSDGGESLVVANGSGLILDSVVYSSTQSNKVSTVTSYSGDVRIFTTNQSPSILSSCNQSTQLPQIGGCRISTTNESYVTGSFSAGFTVSGSLLESACGSSSRSVDGAIVTTNSCSLGSSFAPGSHRIVYQQYSGSSLICEDEYMFYGAIHQQIITNTVTTTIIQTGEQYTCGIVAQHTAPFRFGNSINLIASLNGNELQNSSSYQCQRSGITFTGSDSCNPGYFTLPQAILAPLQLTISKDGHELCQTQSFINYPSVSSSSSSSVSSSTYYEDLYRKRKEKHNILSSNIRQQGCTVNAQDQLGGECSFDASLIQQSSSDTSQTKADIQNQTSVPLYRFQQHQALTIDRIVADPPGRDTDGGELISLIWDDVQAQSGADLLLVINNKANRVVVRSGGSHGVQEINDSFPLPNDGGCVALTDLEIIYDQVCYGNYTSSDMLDVATIEITSKMRELYAGETQMRTMSDNDDEISLLKLDLREQKLINKVLKQEQYKEIGQIRDQYHQKTNELYTTYRSITDQKQGYIDYLKSRLGSTQKYADDITTLYRKAKGYTTQYRTIKTSQDDLRHYIGDMYPALMQDVYIVEYLGQGSGEIGLPGSGSTILEQQGSATASSLSWWTILQQTIRNLFKVK